MKPQAQTVTPPPKEGQSPFFSVIVPVYNVAPYLEECLDSVLAQTFTDWECLCTDDGSKDGSDLILDAHARRDPRFRITHQPNAGVSAFTIADVFFGGGMFGNASTKSRKKD